MPGLAGLVQHSQANLAQRDEYLMTAALGAVFFVMVALILPLLTKKEHSNSDIPVINMLTEKAFSPSESARYRTVDAICQTIADWIDAGRLGHNDRLPAERMMSAHFATTRITLREALGQLEARGVIYREERRGWCITRCSAAIFMPWRTIRGDGRPRWCWTRGR